ncbi:MAG TPA: methyltransferase domain-containing protein [Candidatus Saccharicenans sp.]|jgi:SAM-dependent methyltransferase|nr:methyltransferase domain-containing protein [Candidatus Saccharicenans sp.]HRD02751.1 methyltransferase domain-containing protein [Candidatus Saccharicenans sp.]
MVKKLPESLQGSGKKWELYEDVDYEAFWDDPAQIRQDRLEKHLISRLLPLSGHRIIDVGCGYGRLYPCYKDRFSTVILFDGSVQLLKKARSQLTGMAYFVAGDINNIPFKDSAFDCVLMIRVLQHVSELGSTLSEISRILSKGGSFVFSYHNKRNAHRILKWIFRQEKDNPYSLQSREVSPALLSHHPVFIKLNLEQVGFTNPSYLGAVYIRQLADIKEKISTKVPSGSRWSSLMGKLLAAPWLIGTSKKRIGSEAELGNDLINILVCPICKSSLQEENNGFFCRACRRQFPFREGILDFRP